MFTRSSPGSQAEAKRGVGDILRNANSAFVSWPSEFATIMANEGAFGVWVGSDFGLILSSSGYPILISERAF